MTGAGGSGGIADHYGSRLDLRRSKIDFSASPSTLTKSTANYAYKQHHLLPFPPYISMSYAI